MRGHMVMLAALLIVVGGCGVPEDEYDAVVSERDSLLEYRYQLEAEHGILGEQYKALEAVSNELGGENQALILENENLQAELSDLRPVVDDEALRLEIEGLRQERDQLLSAIEKISVAASELAGTRPAYWAGYACTGSMRPFFNCGDVGIYLASPEVGDIGVGDVVDFPEYTFSQDSGETQCSFPALPYEGKYFAHRVIAKRTEGDTTYYLTKGDANVDADPCWIPFTYVNSKLIRVLEDVRPEDVIDTTEYDAALEIYRRVQRRYNELESTYDEEIVYYQQVEAAYLSGVVSYGTYLPARESMETAQQELIEVSLLLDEAEKEFRRIEVETFGE